MSANPRLLLIDDDPVRVETLAEYRQQQGPSVTSAGGAATALALVRKHC